MNLGEKIVRLRKDKGMSQERLAEVLEVSRQAVYKWEINESVPDMGKISKMVELFGVSYDFLLNDKIGFDGKVETPEPEKAITPIKEEAPIEIEEEKEDEPVPEPEPPKPLGKCAVCGKEIYEASDLIKHPATFTLDHNGIKQMTSQEFIECRSCQNKTLKALNMNDLASLQKKNRLAIILGCIITPIVFAILLGISIYSGHVGLIVGSIVIGILLFPTIYSIVLDNTFAGEWWADISSWGFVRMPGIIFSLSFDGIVFLIATKILLSILAFALVAFCVILATLICMVFSPITFPMSIKRYIDEKARLNATIAQLSKK